MNKLIQVIPAVLTHDLMELKAMLQLTGSFTDYVQIDIMDGKFVSSRSITAEQIAGLHLRIKWEAHLMIEQPAKQLNDFKKAGASKVIFHFEATSEPEKVIFAGLALGLEIGLAVNPETPVSSILPLTGKVDSVLFLSVHPGFYNAQFIPEVLDKIAELRRLQPGIKIGIDGGIKETNISLIAKSGVNQIFVGSAIFLQPQPAESYHKLTALANNQGA
jgi:ribulose-phosphate 3-epimerase